MDSLIDWLFRSTRLVLTSLIVCILFGAVSFRTMPREAEPDITAPFVMVSMPLPGISPEDGERLLVRPTELELQTVDGLKQMDSLSYDGAARIFLEFQTTIDIDQAVLDVREAVDRAQSKYPADAEEPVVTEFNLQSEEPILTIILSGKAPERSLYKTARALQDKLESTPGVLDARLTGAREELLEVIVNPRTLEVYGLTEIEVVNAVRANNRLVTAGQIDLADGRFVVKAPGVVKDGRDLMSIPLRASGDRVVTIADIAEVRRTFVDRDGYALFNGEPAMGIEITKRIGANIVETIAAVRNAVEESSARWPPTVHHAFLNDNSEFVQENLDGLTSSVMQAVLLVMIVVVAFLGLRSAVMIGIAIPTSFLMGFMLLSAFGFTLNMMVMFGLVLAVGMLVDGAIVVIEYADRRMSEGAPRREAYLEASKRMFWPVVTSTATTLAAFVPFLFWDDITGDFMKFLPITLIFVLTSSLVVALIFLPVIGAAAGYPPWIKKRFNIKGKTDAPPVYELEEIDPKTLPGPMGRYARLLADLVRRPLLVMAGAVAFAVISVAAFVMASPDVEFFIESDREEVYIFVQARGNLSAGQSLEITKEVAARIENHPDVEHVYIQTGPGLGRSNNLPPDTVGQITLDLVEYSERRKSKWVVEELRGLVDGVPGVKIEVRQPESGPPIGKDVQVELTSLDLEAMIAGARKLDDFVRDATIETSEGPVHVYMDQEDTLPLPGIEWSMDVDRELAGRYGVTVSQAGAFLQFMTSGLLVDKYRPDDSEDEIDIRLRYPEEERSILGLDRIRVNTPEGAVPLSNFVSREPKPQVDRIVRRDGERIIEVKANANTRVAGREVSQDQAIAEMKKYLESGALGDPVSWRIRGADEETQEAANFFGGAMAAALFMIALILLLEFNSFYHAGLTLTAVVFSTFGVLLGIALTGQYVSVIMTGIGVVALAGIVVNNNIVLIDTYQHLRRRGLAVEEAVVRTATQRFRPVLLTTVTTILGLVPMALEINVDFAAGTIVRGSATSDWWVLLASAVIYGLAFSSLLTLLLTPALLAAPTVLSKRYFARKGAAAPAKPERPAIAQPKAAE
jgi:multidrug efflux pump